jgi:hypothetical protein
LEQRFAREGALYHGHELTNWERASRHFAPPRHSGSWASTVLEPSAFIV